MLELKLSSKRRWVGLVALEEGTHMLSNTIHCRKLSAQLAGSEASVSSPQMDFLAETSRWSCWILPVWTTCPARVSQHTCVCFEALLYWGDERETKATLEVELSVIGVKYFELGANSDGISAGFCHLGSAFLSLLSHHWLYHRTLNTGRRAPK